MKQVEVVALLGFEHNGTRRRGDGFQVSAQHAEPLLARGLVRLADEAAEQQAGTTAPPAALAAVVADLRQAITTEVSRTSRRKTGKAADKPADAAAVGDQQATGAGSGDKSQQDPALGADGNAASDAADASAQLPPGSDGTGEAPINPDAGAAAAATDAPKE